MQEDIRNIFISKYNKAGSEQFYDFLVNYATNRVDNVANIKGSTPEVELMGYYEQFLALYRQDGQELYLDIARIFRRASHKIYHLMIKRDMIGKNDRFLNLVE